MERGKLPEIPVPAWPQTATARLTNHPLSNREFLEVPYKRHRILACSLSNAMGWDELSIGIDRHKRPLVAQAGTIIIRL